MLAQDFFICGERTGYGGLRLEVGGNRWGWPLRIMGDPRGGALEKSEQRNHVQQLLSICPPPFP